ncbi:MAG: pyridoxamine 5'-phosphate oxidase family protein [Rhizobacter sp.]|nr:pyridoxamine 5'-phosphate oxidase family protein [Chlorobiales bacterium]
MINVVKSLADDVQRRMVVATVDRQGVANLAPEFIVDVTDDAIVFCKFPDSRTLENIRHNPQGCVSIVDWARSNGYQIKGYTEPLATFTPYTPEGQRIKDSFFRMGATQLVKISIDEIHDVVPRQNVEMLWQGPHHARYAAVKQSFTPFEKPSGEPSAFEKLRPELNVHIKALLKNKFNSFVGTVDRDGSPNISPRFMVEAGTNYILWGDKFKNKTFRNFSRPSPISLCMIDWQNRTGYQLKGWATFRISGEWVAKVTASWKELGFKTDEIMQSVLLHPEEIDMIKIGVSTPVWKGRNRNVWIGGAAAAADLSAEFVQAAQTAQAAEPINAAATGTNSKPKLFAPLFADEPAVSAEERRPSAPVVVAVPKTAVILSDDGAQSDPLAQSLAEALAAQAVTVRKESVFRRTQDSTVNWWLQLNAPDAVVLTLFAAPHGNTFNYIEKLGTVLRYLAACMEHQPAEKPLKFIVMVSETDAQTRLPELSAIEAYFAALLAQTEKQITLIFLYAPEGISGKAAVDAASRLAHLCSDDGLRRVAHIGVPATP